MGEATGLLCGFCRTVQKVSNFVYSGAVWNRASHICGRVKSNGSFEASLFQFQFDPVAQCAASCHLLFRVVVVCLLCPVAAVETVLVERVFLLNIVSLE
jgi:hypothetical protein